MIRRFSIFACLFSAFVLFNAPISQAEPTTSAATLADAGEYIYVYLQNSCTHDVRFEVKYSGQSSSGTVYKKDKKRLTVQPGAKLYIDGELFMDVEDSDDGETYVVCR